MVDHVGVGVELAGARGPGSRVLLQLNESLIQRVMVLGEALPDVLPKHADELKQQRGVHATQAFRRAVGVVYPP
jgi:hypothetical protein